MPLYPSNDPIFFDPVDTYAWIHNNLRILVRVEGKWNFFFFVEGREIKI